MDPDVSYLNFTLTTLVLILLCAFFSLTESAVITANDGKIKKLAEEGNKPAKRLLKLLKIPSEFMATVQTGITLCGLFVIAYITNLYPTWAKMFSDLTNISFRNSLWIVFALATLIAGFLIILFGKLIPKRIGEHNSESLALSLIPVFYVFSIILKPISKILSKITDLILKLFGFNPKHNAEQVTEEEIRMLVDEGEEKGVIEQSEKYMINNIFEMDDREISEIMTHRMDVVAVPKTASFDEILKLFIDTGYSRIPVYDKDLDDISGIVYVKDLINYLHNTKKFNLEKCARSALFVPESVSFTELLKIFKKEKKQFAVVVDEYGGTYGIITMEDLLESIVGDIQDEYDNEEEEFEKSSDGSIIFDASISLDDAERELDIELENDDDKDYDTLGAIIIDELGYIPESGENPVVVISGISFQVLESDGKRILKVKAEFINRNQNENSEDVNKSENEKQESSEDK